MNWCRILNGIVQEIIQSPTNPNGVLYHPSLIWVQDASGLAKVGWSYANGSFSAPVVVNQIAPLIPQAQAALTRSDSVAIRCFKAGVVFPSAWQVYTAALRAIVNGTDTTSTTLPTQPAYPAGT